MSIYSDVYEQEINELRTKFSKLADDLDEESQSHSSTGEAYQTGFCARRIRRILMEVKQCQIKINTLSRSLKKCGGDLTKREWFAGLAMQAMISSEEYCRSIYNNRNVGENIYKDIAGESYKHADAMLAQPEKEEN